MTGEGAWKLECSTPCVLALDARSDWCGLLRLAHRCTVPTKIGTHFNRTIV